MIAGFNMKNIALMLACLASFNGWSNEEYKCYLSLSTGEKRVALAPKSNSLNQMKANLISTGIYAKDGKTKLKVTKVHECVRFSQKFSNDKARTLDERSLF
ncbi:hypothetical protein XM47_11810 [Catenovulum maritimum]|uniref:Uncharacterized protein n=1 Tax=Catenovulum maritimum TaxID=1513271 RepID=A0A0J8GQ25_9ALTE|nr:hypothetical protein XM47_11810 [Catenovulum maritimum]